MTHFIVANRCSGNNRDPDINYRVPIADIAHLAFGTGYEYDSCSVYHDDAKDDFELHITPWGPNRQVPTLSFAPSQEDTEPDSERVTLYDNDFYFHSHTLGNECSREAAAQWLQDQLSHHFSD